MYLHLHQQHYITQCKILHIEHQYGRHSWPIPLELFARSEPLAAVIAIGVGNEASSSEMAGSSTTKKGNQNKASMELP